jgi:hypothetical protein
MSKLPGENASEGPKPATLQKSASPKAKLSPRPPASKAEHAARKRADKQIAKPWMKKR